VRANDRYAPRVNILGVHVSAIGMTDALRVIETWLAKREPNYICVTPAHGVMDGYRNQEVRRFLNASGLTTPDGMAIVWLLKLRGMAGVERVYGPDLLLRACGHFQAQGVRHFFYGGAPGVPEKLAAVLARRFPQLQVAGVLSPPYRPLTAAEDARFIEEIRSKDADIVWVGLSTPRQDRWMAEHVGRVGAPVLIGVGAAFDFVSGEKRQAPRWMQRAGLEWFFRLTTEPRRLWRRYTAYPLFALLAVAQLLGIARYD
jgi:N-acetylglucosaminyldiphosphoundecaprenol N-acetyl-beta-D-mannosaminyltransferase